MISMIKNETAASSNLMELKKAARGFEAIMVEKMLEEMDKSLPKDPWVKDNSQNSIYKSMYFDALSKQMAEHSAFGISKMLFDSLKDYVEYAKKAKQEITQAKKNNFIKIDVAKNILPDKLDVVKLLKETDFKPITTDVKFSKDIVAPAFSSDKMESIKKSIEKASKIYHVPEKLIYSIIKAESDFNPDVVSRTGAMGLMQLMPQTALELGVKNAWNIEENIMGGTKYIASLINKFKNQKLAIAAYNAGPGNVSKYKGVPPFKETRNYVKKVLAYVDGKY
jgi:soluble lytic murein transglycosylase-like protein